MISHLTSPPTGLKPWIVGGTAFGLTACGAIFVIVVIWRHDAYIQQHLSITAPATVTAVNPPFFAYVFGVCKGASTRDSVPTVGSQIEIYTDPDRPCVNVADDPAGTMRSDLAWVISGSVLVALAIGSAGWDFGRVAQRMPD